MMDLARIVAARERLLAIAEAHFARQPGVLGLYLGGSLPAGTADAYSDIDLRVVVEAEAHRGFVERRLDIPRQWDGFLFNEWLHGAAHCVSHFRPVVKIDIFYLSQSAFAPSPWLTLPLKILYDPRGLVADVVARSRGLTFALAEEDINRSIGKGLAALHEAYRRVRRGELIHAQALLDELRLHMAQADDWARGLPSPAVVLTRFERRASPPVLDAMAASCVPLDPASLDRALRALSTCYRRQVLELHQRFRLQRERDLDIEAIEIVLVALERQAGQPGKLPNS